MCEITTHTKSLYFLDNQKKKKSLIIIIIIFLVVYAIRQVFDNYCVQQF